MPVLVSPVVEACPSEHKEQTMSLLHSFYCWGHVGVVLITTVFFRIFGIGNWKVLAGDLGCSGGPTVVGMVSSFFGEDLKKGILAAVLFPLLLLFGIGQCKKSAANI